MSILQKESKEIQITLLKAVGEMLKEPGYQNLSISQVSKESGISEAINMFYTVLILSVNFMTMYGGGDFRSKEVIENYLKGVEWTIDILFSKYESKKSIEKVAIRAYKQGLKVNDIAVLSGLLQDKINELVKPSQGERF